MSSSLSVVVAPARAGAAGCAAAMRCRWARAGLRGRVGSVSGMAVSRKKQAVHAGTACSGREGAGAGGLRQTRAMFFTSAQAPYSSTTKASLELS